MESYLVVHANGEARVPTVYYLPTVWNECQCVAGHLRQRQEHQRHLANGKKPKQYILFVDSDEDDIMAITIMAIQQVLYNKIELAGIVVEDGYLPIERGLKLVYYWTQRLFPGVNIPIIAGESWDILASPYASSSL